MAQSTTQRRALTVSSWMVSCDSLLRSLTLVFPVEAAAAAAAAAAATAAAAAAVAVAVVVAAALRVCSTNCRGTMPRG